MDNQIDNLDSVEDLISVQDLILDFRNDINFQKLYSRYSQKSFSEILSIHRWERSHSSFLAWLFDDNESHGIGDFSIKKLLEIVIRRDSAKIKQKIKQAIVSGSYNIENVKVDLEKYIDSKTNSKNGYIDIYIQFSLITNKMVFPISVIIENKVDSSEKEDTIEIDGEKTKIHQTQRYYEYFRDTKEYNDFEKIYLYLTPIGNIELNKLTEPECKCKEFIQINYQHLVDHLLDPILQLENLSSRTKLLVQEYVHSLSQPSLEYIEEDDNQTKKQTKTKTLIMAMQQEEKDLLLNIWENNEQFFYKLFEAIKTDESIDEKVREEVGNVSNAVKDSKVKYKYKEHVYGVGRLALELIKDFVSDNKIRDINELRERLPDKMDKRLTRWVNTRTEAEEIEKNDKNRHFLKDEELITLGDSTRIAVTTEWTRDNIIPLIDQMKKYHYKIEQIK